MVAVSVDTILNRDNLKSHSAIENQIELYHMTGIIKVPAKYSMSFDHRVADIIFIGDAEAFNFTSIQDGTTLAIVSCEITQPLDILD